MRTFDPLTLVPKRGVATGDGDGEGADAVWSAARRRTPSNMRAGFRYVLTDESSPKAKRWAGTLTLIRTKGIVVERILRPNPIAIESEQKCQNLLHETYLLVVDSLPRRPNRRSNAEAARREP